MNPGQTSVQVFARVQRALAFLLKHPDGLPLAVLAEHLEVSEKQLRKDLIAFYSADIPPGMLGGLVRADSIQFFADEGHEDDPQDAFLVRVVGQRPEAELGVEYLRPDQLAQLYRAAQSLSEAEPDNAVLASAVRTFEEQFLGAGSLEPAESETDSGVAELLRVAVDQRRTVRIEYSRAWDPGVYTREVEPYALKRTMRGWELDAGPLREGHARTYIVSRIRSVVVGRKRFDRPSGMRDLLAADRREEHVDLSLPQRQQWVADRFAERTQVLESDMSDVALRCWFLPPVRDRVGLVLASAGPDAFVIEPNDLAVSGVELAERLLNHHGLG